MSKQQGPSKRVAKRGRLRRLALMRLDGALACAYCGATGKLTIDHVVPVARAAEFGVEAVAQTASNRVLCCMRCNWVKASMTPPEVGLSIQPWVRRREELERLYASRAAPLGTDADLDRVYANIDRLLRAGCFRLVDRALAWLDVRKTPTVLLLAYATVTSAASEQLEGRGAFVARVREHLCATDPSRVNELLAGLG